MIKTNIAAGVLTVLSIIMAWDAHAQGLSASRSLILKDTTFRGQYSDKEMEITWSATWKWDHRRTNMDAPDSSVLSLAYSVKFSNPAVYDVELLDSVGFALAWIVSGNDLKGVSYNSFYPLSNNVKMNQSGQLQSAYKFQAILIYTDAAYMKAGYRSMVRQVQVVKRERKALSMEEKIQRLEKYGNRFKTDPALVKEMRNLPEGKQIRMVNFIDSNRNSGFNNMFLFYNITFNKYYTGDSVYIPEFEKIPAESMLNKRRSDWVQRLKQKCFYKRVNKIIYALSAKPEVHKLAQQVADSLIRIVQNVDTAMAFRTKWDFDQSRYYIKKLRKQVKHPMDAIPNLIQGYSDALAVYNKANLNVHFHADLDQTSGQDYCDISEESENVGLTVQTYFPSAANYSYSWYELQYLLITKCSTSTAKSNVSMTSGTFLHSHAFSDTNSICLMLLPLSSIVMVVSHPPSSGTSNIGISISRDFWQGFVFLQNGSSANSGDILAMFDIPDMTENYTKYASEIDTIKAWMAEAQENGLSRFIYLIKKI